MMPAKPEARERVVFAATILSPRLRSDVLNDGQIARRFELSLTRPLTLEGVTIEQGDLFAVLRLLADGAPGPLPVPAEGDDEAVEATVMLEDDAGVVSIRKHRHRFEDARMLASDADERRAVLERSLQRLPLARAEALRLLDLVGRPDFDDNDFLEVVDALAGSPQSFVEKFARVTRKGVLSLSDFLPDDWRHWEHLVQRYQAAHSLDDYMEAVLKPRATARIGAPDALRAISLTFATPALIPKGLLGALDEKDRLKAIRDLRDFGDPFSLLAALHYCTEHWSDETSEIGEGTLKDLFEDTETLETFVQIYSAVFVIASAELAEHERLGRYPPFWRRLAAHAHATLVVRASLNVKGPMTSLVDEAFNHRGAAFYMSAIRDAVLEPRWRPDWIAPPFVMADIWGRALNTIKLLGEKCPPAWTAWLGRAETWLEGKTTVVSAHFPAPLEGALKPAPELQNLKPYDETIEALVKNPTAEDFLRLSALVYAYQAPRELEAPAIEIVRRAGRGLPEPDAELVGPILSLGAYVAVLLKSEPLAQAVSDAIVVSARRGDKHVIVTEAGARLIEAAAAYKDMRLGYEQCGNALGALAYCYDAKNDLRALLDLIEAAGRVDPALSVFLGRAKAIARLGAGRAGLDDEVRDAL